MSVTAPISTTLQKHTENDSYENNRYRQVQMLACRTTRIVWNYPSTKDEQPITQPKDNLLTEEIIRKEAEPDAEDVRTDKAISTTAV